MESNNQPGKVVWITGASRGIGKAIAQRLVREGYRVALSARNADALRELADEFGSEQVL